MNPPDSHTHGEHGHVCWEGCEALKPPTARELCEAIRKRDDTDAAIIGANLATRVEKVLAQCELMLTDPSKGHCRWMTELVLRLLNGEER